MDILFENPELYSQSATLANLHFLLFENSKDIPEIIELIKIFVYKTAYLFRYFFIFSLAGIGFTGVILNSKNLIITLMCIEIMLVGINISLILNACVYDDILGQIFSILILTVAAAEAAIGLGLVVAYYKIKKSIYIESFSELKG